jgi:protein-disulfide isomerase
MKKENAIIGMIAIGIIAFVAGRMTAKPPAPAPAAATPATPENVPAPVPAAAAATDRPALGPATAKITLVEVSDFQCPFCSRAAKTVDELKAKYKDDLRVVFVHQPLSFHDRAKPAAIASMAAHKQGKFWEMYKLLFENQRELTDDNFKKWGQQIGLDMAKFDADLKDPAIAAGVDKDSQMANALGVRGTPGFFVNGVNIAGAVPIEEFEKVIAEQITKANDELGKGTKATDLNEKLTAASNPQLGDKIVRWVFKGEPVPADAAPAEAPRKKREEDTTTVWKTSLRGDEPSKGSADALVTIVEYTDFQCPFCSKARGSLDEVEKNYGDKVRIVFKNLPLDFHKNAFGAAEAALCGKDQGKFWEMEKRLFENQQTLDADQLAGHAKEAGLDVAKFEACMRDHKHKAAVESDMAAAEKVQATGTPAFYIQGRKLGGARPFDDFKKIIDEEFAKAEKAVAAGTAKKDVFAKAIENGKEFTPPPPLDAKVNNFDYEGSPHKGPRNAPVKIVEYKDFQCPFCAKVIPTLKQVEKNHQGKVAIVFKHFPLSSQCNPDMGRDMHPAACLAAYWSIAAEDQGKFWEFEEIVFNNFSQMMPQDGELDARLKALEENLKKYAKEAGVDVAKAEAFVKAKKYEPRLKKDMAEAKAAEVRGTPSMYINGRSYQGPMSPAKMTEIVQKVLDGRI